MVQRLIFICFLFFSVLVNNWAQSVFYNNLADSALVLTKKHVIYDPSYYSIDYPNGDIPEGRGVCTDVIIRAYRMFNIDLQKLVHIDMKSNFQVYPKKWGLITTDKNIDHRRVPNLMTYFSRHGDELEISIKSEDYTPGDIVCWNLGGAVTHIGIVSNIKSIDKSRYMIIHNIGSGQVLEDCLFKYDIIGHYRFSVD